MKTLRKTNKVLDMSGLLMVNGGYSGSSGGTSFSGTVSCNFSSSGQGSSVTSSYAARCVSNYKTSGYVKNYAIICGWAKAHGLM